MSFPTFAPLPLSNFDNRIVILPLDRVIAYRELEDSGTTVVYVQPNRPEAEFTRYTVKASETTIDDLMLKHALAEGIRLVTPTHLDGMNFSGRTMRVNFANIGPITGYTNDHLTGELPDPVNAVFHNIDALLESISRPDGALTKVRVTSRYENTAEPGQREHFGYAPVPLTDEASEAATTLLTRGDSTASGAAMGQPERPIPPRAGVTSALSMA